MDSSPAPSDQNTSLTHADAGTPASTLATGDTSSDSATSTRSAGSKRKSATGPAAAPTERVGQPYRLTQNSDWGIRYAALMLEQQDGQRRTQQDLVDMAVTELLQRLKKKGMDFPSSILP